MVRTWHLCPCSPRCGERSRAKRSRGERSRAKRSRTDQIRASALAIVETGYRQGGIDTCSCLFRKTQIIPKETPTNPTVHYAVKDPASERGMRNVSSFFIVCGMPYSANDSILGEGHSGMTVIFYFLAVFSQQLKVSGAELTAQLQALNL